MFRIVLDRPITSYLFLACCFSWLIWINQMADSGNAGMSMWINYIVLCVLGALVSASVVMLLALFTLYADENADRSCSAKRAYRS